MWFESKDQLPTPRSVDWKPATKEATSLLLRLDVPSMLLDVPPCWEEWVHSPTHLPTHKGSLFDSVIVWAFAEEFEQWKKIKYVLQSHCLREWNLGVRSTLYLHAFGGGGSCLSYSEVEEDLKPVTCLDLYNGIKIPGCYCGNHTLKIRSWHSLRNLKVHRCHELRRNVAYNFSDSLLIKIICLSVC